MTQTKYTAGKYVSLITNAERALEASLDYNERWAIEYWTGVVNELNASYRKKLN